MRRPLKFIFSLIPLTMVSLPSVSKAAASFQSVEQPGFYPEIGQGTDGDHLRVYGSAFTADSREKLATQPGLESQKCRFEWVDTAEKFRDFYNVDVGAEARANFGAYKGGGRIDYSKKEKKVRSSSTGMFAMDILVIAHRAGISSFTHLKLTPEARQLLLQNREKFHEEFGTEVMFAYHKGARCVGLFKFSEEESSKDMVKNFKCTFSAGNSFLSGNFSLDQKNAMDEAFSMASTESDVDYVGAPSGLPEKITNSGAVATVFSRLTQHVDKDGGGIRVNWISVPYDQIDDYKNTVIGLTIPFGINILMSNDINDAYKALMNVRHYLDRVTCELPKDTKTRGRLKDLERAIKVVGKKIVEKQELSPTDIQLITMCESEDWPEEIPRLLEPKEILERRAEFEETNREQLKEGVIDEHMFKLLALHHHDTCWLVHKGKKMALQTVYDLK